MTKVYYVWIALVVSYLVYANHYGKAIGASFFSRAVTHSGAPTPGLHHK